MPDRHRVSSPRHAALAALKAIRQGGYANLSVNEVLSATHFSQDDNRFVTQLVFGTCRNMGVLDRVIQRASGRSLGSLQPAVIDVLRLGAEQLLRMRVASHAAVSSSTGLAGLVIGTHATGVVNAILRRVCARDWDGWLDELTKGVPADEALGLRTSHPTWIANAYADLLAPNEVALALEANNQAPVPTLAIRPTLMTREELLAWGGEATPYSPWGVTRPGDPAQVAPIHDGRAGVQDEGSQLVAGILASADTPGGPWLDMCAGPGGKAALLTGLARERGEVVLAAEVHPHRAQLVRSALHGFGTPLVVVADGRVPGWRPVFSAVMVDAPCTGLGALRRRPEARWRKTPADLTSLVPLQTALLRAACASVVPHGVVAYVTCSPHREETIDIVRAVQADTGFEIMDAPALLPGVPDAVASTDPRCVQLWPHRHRTDAMFACLLRRPA